MARAREAADDPMVYVLLVNWRGWSDTLECLESVFRQDYGRFRVIVCNNDPGDDSISRIAAWAGQEGVRDVLGATANPRRVGSRAGASPVVEIWGPESDFPPAGQGAAASLVLIETGQNLGFAGGNNVGLDYIGRQGDADYVWLLNNDTIVDPGALRGLVDLAESRPDAGMVGSKLLHHGRPDVIQTIAGGRIGAWTAHTTFIGGDEPDAGQWEDVLEVEYITGASLLVRMSTIEEVGILDERYFLYSEEVDWCLRARKKGWKLLYAPGSRVWHKGGQSVGYGSALHDYYFVRSMLLLVHKFYPALLPFTLVYSVYRCMAPKLVRLQFDRLRAVLNAYRDFVRVAHSRSGGQEDPRFGAGGSQRARGVALDA